MSPTIHDGELLLVNNNPSEIEQGDIVVVQMGASSYIKRVVALSGDQLECKDDEVFVNGKKVSEVKGKTKRIDMKNIIVSPIPDNSVFVLGDNLEKSYDSREVGPISKGSIKGKVVW